MSLKVINPGAMTTVQDGGRLGYQYCGIPQSGAMDREAYRRANAALSNAPSDAVLEMTLFGGIYRFESDTAFAVTGADMQPTLNGRPVFFGKETKVRAGEVLSLGAVRSGCRTYLAVKGGILVPEVLGSRSTTVRCHLGGLDGRALKAGDNLPIGSDTLLIKDNPAEAAPAPGTEEGEEPSSPAGSRPYYSDDITVRAIAGPQEEKFTDRGIDTFYHTVYTVSLNSDRMGCRLQGAAVESLHGSDIISDGTAFGSVQITSSGMPIVLMADRQTTGGYAKIATVISADLPLLAQAVPGTKVHFKKITVEEAQTYA